MLNQIILKSIVEKPENKVAKNFIKMFIMIKEKI